MKWLLLSLALVTQTPTPVKVGGAQSVPAYSLAKLKASNATAPLKWSVYQLTPVGSYSSGEDFVFTAPPGSYLVVLNAANGSNTWQIQFTTPTGPPNPNLPPPTPQPQPIPSPPKPGVEIDPDTGFVYPTDNTSFSAAIARATRSASASTEDAAAMSDLYSFVARKIRIDGRLRQPKLKTLADAMALTKTTEEELVKTSKVRPIKETFPEVAKLAAAELAQANPADQLTKENRAQYVQFLNELASGFEAKPQ